MEWMKKNTKEIQQKLNIWFQEQGYAEMNVTSLPKKIQFNSNNLKILSSILYNFSKVDAYTRMNSEFRIFDKLYIQSRFQIRSFPYLRTLRKFRQTLKKFFSLQIKDICETVAATKVMSNSLITQNSFESLQWRFLACYQLLIEIVIDSYYLAELLTQEMTTNVFLHFPVVFFSLCSSISKLADEYRMNVLETFRQLRTIDMKKIIPFQISEQPNFPELPWDPSFEVPIEGVQIVQTPTLKPQIAKVDLTINAKPNFQLRGKPGNITKKPKSSLDSLGF